VLGDWSATFCFRTGDSTARLPLPEQQAAAPWAWAVIAIGALLDIGLLIVIFRRASARTGQN